jgi:hypothetical protein
MARLTVLTWSKVASVSVVSAVEFTGIYTLNRSCGPEYLLSISDISQTILRRNKYLQIWLLFVYSLLQ